MTEILLGIGFISLLLVALAAVVHKVREYLLPSRPVAVTVNGGREIGALANFKLLDILNSNGIAVPSGCAGAGSASTLACSGQTRRSRRVPGTARLAIANSNVPNMVGQISTCLAEAKLNIADLLNKSRGEYAYTLIDADGGIPAAVRIFCRAASVCVIASGFR